MTGDAGHREGLDDQALLLVAGLADLAIGTLGSALGTFRGCCAVRTRRSWPRTPSGT